MRAFLLATLLLFALFAQQHATAADDSVHKHVNIHKGRGRDKKSHNSESLNRLSNSCLGKADGDYWLLLSDAKTDYMPVYLRCSNEYVIIDVSKDDALTDYFSTYLKWHYAIAGPSNSNPVTWEEWFLPDTEDLNANSKYLISPSCDVCDESATRQVFDTKTSYWMSGNLAKLTWSYVGFNDCDMDKDTYQCYDCTGCKTSDSPVCTPKLMEETATDWTVTGICPTAVQASNRVVQRTRTLGMLHKTKPHFKPSLGTDGRYCVCYQPSAENSKNYKLSDSQKRYISDKTNEMAKASNNNNKNKNDLVIKSMHRVDGHKVIDIESDTDLRDSNFVYLSQSDFEFGTYRIKKSGTYIITEDITFDFNKDDDYWPRVDQDDEYPGGGGYRDPYFMGFFAGITVEADHVTIDLNGHELKQSLPFYYQQRWFATIELGSQQFLPGQGPGFFGPDAVNIADCTVKDGTLGLTSHFGVHGNFPQSFTLENVHIKDFVTHGIQLNGWSDLSITNVEVGPASSVDYLRGDYGHARLMAVRLRALEEDLTLDGTINNADKTLTFAGREHKGAQTVTDIANELEAQMDLALDYAINRVNGDFKENNYVTPKVLDFSAATSDELERWEKTKEIYIHESGYPSASSITGIFLNFDGASVFTYTKYTNRQSKNGKLTNVYIHDLVHDMYESHRIDASSTKFGTSRMYTSPWLSDFPAQHMFGTKEKLIEFRDIATKTHQPFVNDFKYVGSSLTDAFIALGTFCDNWDYLGQEMLFQTDDSTNVKYWAIGEQNPPSYWRFGCNQDVMFHSGKGTLGLRIDGTDNLEIENLRVENLHDMSPLGGMACGEYSGSSRGSVAGEGGHLKQQPPIQVGFSGNNVQAVSIVSSSNLLFKGVNVINNINSDFGEGSGISVWTASDVIFDNNAFAVISNVATGKQLDHGKLSYHSAPNRSPEACAFRLEADSSSELYNSKISFNHEDDSTNSGSFNVISCNVQGHEKCLGSDTNGPTLFGNYLSDDSNVCNDFKSFESYQLSGLNKVQDKQQVTHESESSNNSNNNVKGAARNERMGRNHRRQHDKKKNSKIDKNTDSENDEKLNILMIMLDDLGRADIGAFGAEWETPHIDEFIGESISLSHHYIGYVCSASRSQFLTGRYSFHNGYGTLDVFDRAKLGGMPTGTPTIADYLKYYGNYKTYAIGKWQLGSAMDKQTPNYRGFDYFWGFYGGLEDYFDKTATIRPDREVDSMEIKRDKTPYYDFWENGEPLLGMDGEYSTFQYLTKLTEVIGSHTADSGNEDPFFIYAALQAPHMPFPEQDTIFKSICHEKYSKYYGSMNDRPGICEAMLGVDYFMGSLMDYLKSDQKLWDNTLVIFTSDNGGALSHGSCNYPLRGGKNTYFDGNTRVHSFVGGGAIPAGERGTMRSGLFSNVDWLPTLMSFAGLIPNDYTHIWWNSDASHDKKAVPLTFDGYNQYNYLMSSNAKPVRDHIAFQLTPKLDTNADRFPLQLDSSNGFSKHSHTDAWESFLDTYKLDEIAMVFLDDSGKLWKFFDSWESTNEIGDVDLNCNWCAVNENYDGNDAKFYRTETSGIEVKGLYDLTTDVSETNNLFDGLDGGSQKKLLNIIAKNTAQYFTEDMSPSSVYLYGIFNCFYKKFNYEAWPKYLDGVWKPFLTEQQFAEHLTQYCGFDESHMMYKLHTQTVDLMNMAGIKNNKKKQRRFKMTDYVVDKSDLVSVRNQYVATPDTPDMPGMVHAIKKLTDQRGGKGIVKIGKPGEPGTEDITSKMLANEENDNVIVDNSKGMVSSFDYSYFTNAHFIVAGIAVLAIVLIALKCLHKYKGVNDGYEVLV